MQRTRKERKKHCYLHRRKVVRKRDLYVYTYLASSTNLRLTFSQPSGGSLARNLLMWGEVPRRPSLSCSGVEPRLPPTNQKGLLKRLLVVTNMKHVFFFHVNDRENIQWKFMPFNNFNILACVHKRRIYVKKMRCTPYISHQNIYTCKQIVSILHLIIL